LSENIAAMTASAERVVAAEVTRAVRDSMTDAGPVREGDWIGLSRDGIVAIADSVVGASCALLDRLVTDEHELITLIEGEGSTGGDTRRITEWLHEEHPAIAIEEHPGASRSTPTSSGSSERGRRGGRVGPGPPAPPAPGLPVDVLASLSAKKADALATWGVANVLDLLTKYPRRYMTAAARRTWRNWRWGSKQWCWPRCDGRPAPGAQRPGDRRARRPDGTGAMKVVFFNQPWRARQLPPAPRRSSSASSTSTAVRARWLNPVVDVVVGTEGSEKARERTLRVVPV